jgi:CheY-like chemotaxis protein
VSKKPQKILVVDDEAVIRDMMTDILELEGYTIDVARNGRDAFEMVMAVSPAQQYLIFLDLMMPVMDGHEFCHTLNAQPDVRQHHTIIIMSALDQLAQATSLHADAAMPKPFVVDDVLQFIQQYMNQD